MGFESILGNDRVKQQLHNAFTRGRGSHFYLISGPEGSGKRTLARLLAAAFLCEGEEKPCLRCAACRKVKDDVHPDVITVTDPEHKNVAVKIIRQIRDDVFIRPNEGARKIYIFPQNLGTEGQNALLKVLEEPPAYGVFLLLSDNPESVLPTVRSRCVELKLQQLSQDLLEQSLRREFPQAATEAIDGAIARSGGYLGQAKALLTAGTQENPYTDTFVQALSQHDKLLLTQTLARMERLNREQFLDVLSQWLQIVEGALACRFGMPAVSDKSSRLAPIRGAAQWNDMTAQLKKAMEYAQANVSVAAICGHLAHVL